MTVPFEFIPSERTKEAKEMYIFLRRWSRIHWKQLESITQKALEDMVLYGTGVVKFENGDAMHVKLSEFFSKPEIEDYGR